MAETPESDQTQKIAALPRVVRRSLTGIAVPVVFIAGGWLLGANAPMWVILAVICGLLLLSPITSFTITLWLCEPIGRQSQRPADSEDLDD